MKTALTMLAVAALLTLLSAGDALAQYGYGRSFGHAGGHAGYLAHRSSYSGYSGRSYSGHSGSYGGGYRSSGYVTRYAAPAGYRPAYGGSCNSGSCSTSGVAIRPRGVAGAPVSATLGRRALAPQQRPGVAPTAPATGPAPAGPARPAGPAPAAPVQGNLPPQAANQAAATPQVSGPIAPAAPRPAAPQLQQTAPQQAPSQPAPSQPAPSQPTANQPAAAAISQNQGVNNALSLTDLFGSWRATSRDALGRSTIMELVLEADGSATVVVQTQGQEASEFERSFTFRNGQLVLTEGGNTQSLGTLVSADKDQMVLKLASGQGTLTFTRPDSVS